MDYEQADKKLSQWSREAAERLAKADLLSTIRESALRHELGLVVACHENARQNAQKIESILFGNTDRGSTDVAVLTKNGAECFFRVKLAAPEWLQLTFWAVQQQTGDPRSDSPEELLPIYRMPNSWSTKLTIYNGSYSWGNASGFDEKEALLSTAREQIDAFHSSSSWILQSLADPTLNPEYAEQAILLQQA